MILNVLGKDFDINFNRTMINRFIFLLVFFVDGPAIYFYIYAILINNSSIYIPIRCIQNYLCSCFFLLIEDLFRLHRIANTHYSLACSTNRQC